MHPEPRMGGLFAFTLSLTRRLPLEDFFSFGSRLTFFYLYKHPGFQELKAKYITSQISFPHCKVNREKTTRLLSDARLCAIRCSNKTSTSFLQKMS